MDWIGLKNVLKNGSIEVASTSSCRTVADKLLVHGLFIAKHLIQIQKGKLANSKLIGEFSPN